ncbi:MAG: LysR family transcriptional regulator [Oleiphilaceae bacterium]|nr:LysR family transcriptional regulator [Oleiphilaceae bacterium]
MARLNYRHLHYFWRVALDGNLTRVSRTLHVSQSALSAQIRQLEDAMGVELFDRQGRSLTLTEAGQRVLSIANDIFVRGEELEGLMSRGWNSGYQHLRIGILSTLSRNFIEQFIAPLLSESKIQFSLDAQNQHGLLEGLARHQLDLALTNSPVTVDRDEDLLWQSQLLARQPLSIVGPPQGRPEGAFPKGYEGFRWVLPSRHTEMRVAFDAFCSRHRFEPVIQAECNDMAMLRLLTRDSGALAVVPEVVVRDEIRQGTLVGYQVLPKVYESFYAVTIKRQFMPPAVRELLQKFDGNG